MNPEEEVFLQAIEKPAGQRAAFLDELCADDEELRRRIESLLKYYEQEGNFLQNSPFSSELSEDVDSLADSTSDLPLRAIEAEGSLIGRYKLLEKIGEGGFGVVYMAEQQEPVSRRVALKIIKLGMDTKEVIARFEAERQALAMMDHPNIAKVFDAGATDTGRPYFVMELVRGQPVTTFCDQNHINTEDRLRLFIDVCRAIQHAHQKGIIHRDIKPNNVMVTWHDDRFVPKVIDFGVAKATEHRLTEKTVFTRYAQMIGTPTYMSPEQAKLGLDVDTRSDIYSLGVLLYELLTGSPPFDAEKLLSSGYDEMRRRICEEEPPKPSTRLSTMSQVERTEVAQCRQSELSKLNRLLRGELDWIVMKAMEKDRLRRYDTASGFAEDVQHFLNHEPVVAVAPSSWYRLRKFAVRNKASIAAITAIVVALLLGTAISTWQAYNATRQSQRAIIAERSANGLRSRAEASEQLAKRNLYVAEMVLAKRESDTLNSKHALELLHRQIPGPNEPDFRGFEWRSLWHEYHRELFSLQGHTEEIRDLCVSPDGKWLASGSTDGTARLWNLQTQKEVWQFKGGKDCNWVEFSPDGKMLATVFYDGEDLLWDISDPNEPTKIRVFESGGCLSFSPDGKTLASGTRDRLRQWKTSGGLLREYVDPSLTVGESSGKAHLGRVKDIAFSQDGKLLVSAGMDNLGKIWDVSSGNLLATLRGHTDWLLGIAISPRDDDVIVTTSVDGTARVWDRAGNEKYRFPLEHTPLEDVDFSRDGQSLVIMEQYGVLRTFETKTWTETSIIRDLGQGRTVDFSHPGNSIVVSGGSNGVIRAWNTSSDKSLLDHPHPVRALEFSPDGRLLSVGLDNGVVQFWNMDARSIIFSTQETNPQGIQKIAITPYTRGFVVFSPDSKKAAVIGPDKVVTIWDIEKKKPLTVIKSPVERCPFWSVEFSADGTLLYTGTAWSFGKQGVYVWDLQDTQKPITKMDHRGGHGVGCLAVSFDGKILAGGHDDVKLWSLPDMQPIRSLEIPVQPYDKGAFSLCFSPDGSMLVASDVGHTIWVWDTHTWKQNALLHKDIVTCVDFLPEGDRLVAADISGTTKLWDLQTGQPIATYKGSVADFSPQGTILAIGCEGKFRTAMPAAGRVRIIYAPPLSDLDRDRLATDPVD